MRTDVELEWADGTYLFRLPLTGIQEIQEKSKAGFGDVYGRVMAGQYETKDGSNFGMPFEAKWYIEDLHNIIRLGLIGGNHGLVDGQSVEVSAIQARKLVERYCYPAASLKADWNLAAAIIYASVEGIEDTEHKVKKKRVRTSTGTKDTGSTSPQRSASSPVSDVAIL
jgi:hypothetical protein